MKRYATPPGRIVKGWVVRLAPSEEQATQFRRDDGARRFAYNWAVEQMGQAFGEGRETGEYDPAVWSHADLRKRLNGVKDEIAPWWPNCSKEAFSNGIADAVTALRNWHASKTGEREGPPMRFPTFHKKGKDPVRCTYTTGALRVDDARYIVLPRVGRVETAENIRVVHRHLSRGTAKLLSATVREKSGWWTVSLKLEIEAPWQPAQRDDPVGVDVGLGDDLLIVMGPDGEVIEKVPNPRALRSALTDLRRASRALSRKKEGSMRWRKAKRKLGRVHAHVAAIRSDTLHKATTRLAKTHGQVVIEELSPSRHMRGVRARRKSWTDIAAGEFRRQLTYKCAWYDSELWIADRWYPSSKTCSACRHVNSELTLADRVWTCPECGVEHDRDENAGINLARLPASRAEAQSGSKTVLVRRVAMKRVNRPGRTAA